MEYRLRVWTPILYLVLSLPLTGAFAGNATAADDVPTIVKNSVRVTANYNSKDPGGWVPQIAYWVNGPIASGSQLSVEFSLPTKPKWVAFDCHTGEIKKGEWWKVSCGIGYDESVSYAGPVGFTIRLRNELLGTNATLFTGKAKVVKVLSYPGSKSFDFYVNDDWTIPIGYVFFANDPGHRVTSLHTAFWYRGNPPNIEAHLFYMGKDIAKYTRAGNGAGDWDPAKYLWGLAECDFLGVYRTQKEAEDGYDPKFSLEKNPGDYEVKVLIVNKLARSIKFSVDANGIVDNGIATANKLGSDRIIVPVKVIGDQGPWDKLAWKTGAFYGNPLTGFTPIP